MSVLDAAAPGATFGPYQITISREEAGRYAAAVGGTGSPSYGDAVPPLALVAAGLSRLIDSLGLAGGTVHAGQEAEFVRPVAVGESVTATAELRASSVRRDSRFATVETVFTDRSGNVVASSSSTIIVPA